MSYLKTNLLLGTILVLFLFRQNNVVTAAASSLSSAAAASFSRTRNRIISTAADHDKLALRLGPSCHLASHAIISTMNTAMPIHPAFIPRGGARGRRRGGGEYHDARPYSSFSNNEYDDDNLNESHYDNEDPDEQDGEGYLYENDDDDDDDNYDRDDAEYRRPPPPLPPRRHDHRRPKVTAPNPPQHLGRPLPRRGRPTHNRFPNSKNYNMSKRNRQAKSRQQNDPLTKVKDLTQKSLSLATSATMSTLKTGGKAAYYITAPKFVSKREICGVWRFDQSIGSTACAANVEFTPRGDAITKYKGEENVTGYLFQSRNWPLSCTIEFEASAFQGPGDEFPIRYYYKGSFRRKIADKNVIKIVGKIYEVRKGRFGRGNTSGVEVGSFVARKRIILAKKSGNQRRPPMGRSPAQQEDATLLEDEYDEDDNQEEQEEEDYDEEEEEVGGDYFADYHEEYNYDDNYDDEI